MARVGRKMSEETKQKLQAAAKLARGRSTLSGIEHVGVSMALDALFEGRITPVPVTSSPDGPLVRLGDEKFMPSPGDLGTRMRYVFLKCPRLTFTADKGLSRRLIRWVRFNHTPDAVLDLLKASDMERVDVTVPIYTGPHTGDVDRLVTLFRADQAILFLRFLFGEPVATGKKTGPMNWRRAVTKYLTGYTPKYIAYRQHGDALAKLTAFQKAVGDHKNGIAT